MNTIERQIDVNAHVSDVHCVIEKIGRSAVAKISLKNVSSKTITGVKLTAIGYNFFEEIVCVNDQPKYSILIQGIYLPPGRVLRDHQVILPSAMMSRLVLEEAKVRYEDDTIEIYKGADLCMVTLQEYGTSPKSEKALRKAMQNRFGDKFKYVPQEFNKGWICGCGYYNGIETTHCPNCNHTKDDIFQSQEPSRQKQLVGSYRRTWVVRAVCVLVFSVLMLSYIGSLFLNDYRAEQAVLAQRTLYSSASEMRDDVQGVYTMRTSGGLVRYKLKIDGDTMIMRDCYKKPDECDKACDISEWNFHEGTFQVKNVGVFTVSKTGAILLEDRTYNPGGNWLSQNSKLWK